jgi:nitrogen fixation NifU-like protein
MGFDELYQEIILEHSRRPRWAARLDHIPQEMVHENPTCGDSVKLEVQTDGEGRLRRIRHESRGCAISTASASIMAEQLTGMDMSEAREKAAAFIAAMRGELPSRTLEQLGELAAFQGVMRYPLRVKCATLAWHALLAALPAA